ncbi:unnamed protein product [Prorocentrum cordatum]|uniref:RRM domain-containing protein n=1 Tax=Prorocentrum cordatum TaxID=2364126 RepID=A0ABN9S6V7_9DINO|nr:unnamed protein product [Polarella glacialis]
MPPGGAALAGADTGAEPHGAGKFRLSVSTRKTFLHAEVIPVAGRPLARASSHPCLADRHGGPRLELPQPARGARGGAAPGRAPPAEAARTDAGSQCAAATPPAPPLGAEWRGPAREGAGDASGAGPSGFVAAAGAPEATLAEGAPLAVVLQNIPSRCGAEDIIQLVSDSGFRGKFDFINMPMKRNRRQNKGYAFANFSDATDAIDFQRAVNGMKFSRRDSSKAVVVQPARARHSTAQLTFAGDDEIIQSPWGAVRVPKHEPTEENYFIGRI